MYDPIKEVSPANCLYYDMFLFTATRAILVIPAQEWALESTPLQCLINASYEGDRNVRWYRLTEDDDEPVEIWRFYGNIFPITSFESFETEKYSELANHFVNTYSIQIIDSNDNDEGNYWCEVEIGRYKYTSEEMPLEIVGGYNT